MTEFYLSQMAPLLECQALVAQQHFSMNLLLRTEYCFSRMAVLLARQEPANLRRQLRSSVFDVRRVRHAEWFLQLSALDWVQSFELQTTRIISASATVLPDLWRLPRKGYPFFVVENRPFDLERDLPAMRIKNICCSEVLSVVDLTAE